MTGIEYPTITVGERALVVRFSLAAQTLMRRRGIDISNLAALTDPKSPETIDNWLAIFACCVDENFGDFSRPEFYKAGQGPSADYWATQILPHEMGRICSTINESARKVLEASKLRAISPPTQLEALAG